MRYIVIGSDREQARALKKAINNHLDHRFRTALTKVADEKMIRRFGIESLPALMFFGNYPEDDRNGQILFQGSPDPGPEQLGQIEAAIAEIAGKIQRSTPEFVSRELAAITGIVRNRDSLEPLFRANIEANYVRTEPRNGRRAGTVTRSDGTFSIATITEGTIDLAVMMPGYREERRQLTADGLSTHLMIDLEPLAGEERAIRQPGIFSGIIRLSLESHLFIPDSETVERYFQHAREMQCWVDLPQRTLSHIGNESSCVVSLEGALHGPGCYGHMGAYTHHLDVEKILTLTPTRHVSLEAAGLPH